MASKGRQRIPVRCLMMYFLCVKLAMRSDPVSCGRNTLDGLPGWLFLILELHTRQVKVILSMQPIHKINRSGLWRKIDNAL